MINLAQFAFAWIHRFFPVSLIPTDAMRCDGKETTPSCPECFHMTDAAIEARLHLSYVDVIKIECATHITVWRRRWNFFFCFRLLPSPYASISLVRCSDCRSFQAIACVWWNVNGNRYLFQPKTNIATEFSLLKRGIESFERFFFLRHLKNQWWFHFVLSSGVRYWAEV